YLQITFSRVVLPDGNASDSTNYSLTGTNTLNLAFNWAGMQVASDGKMFTLKLVPGAVNAFVPGSDTLSIDPAGPGLYDLAQPSANRCLTEQKVIVQPQ
ncbi:MAG TPA: hypothetical protein PKO06_17770, partial [Candidatus Ozemobacteraceae bacterium]|nr:hypothetical protein [Candidatus Ozemobacteraceae bacterium]